MNRYYLFIDREKTKIYRKEDLGNPMYFDIEGRRVCDLCNTLRVDYDNGDIIYCPLKHSFETNYINVFEVESMITGILVDFYGKSVIMFKNIFELLKEDKAEFILILSNSLIDSTIEIMNKFDMAYFTVFDATFKRINGKCSKNNTLLKVIMGEHLSTGFSEFLRGETKENVLYIDDKVMNYLSFCKYGVNFNAFSWNRASKKDGSLITKNFGSYLNDEAKSMSVESSNNLRSFIIHKAKKYEYIKNFYLIRRDERIDIDCSPLIDYYNKEKENSIKVLQDAIFDYTQDNVKYVVLNFNDKTKEEQVKNFINEKGFELMEKFNKDNLKYRLLVYADCIDKYSKPLYLLRIKEIVKNHRGTIDNYLFENYILSLYGCLKQKEIDEVCRLLDVKNFKAYYQ